MNQRKVLMRSKSRWIQFLIGVVIILVLDGYSTCLAKGNEEHQSKKKLIYWFNIRFRYEYQDNFNLKYYGDHPKKGESNDGFLLGRLRTGLDYYPSENIHIALGIQHSEVWDLAFKESDFYSSALDREHNSYEDSWELYNTYLEIKHLFSQPVTVKLGRQKIFYGNKRVFGPGNWGNTGSWCWDAARVSYKIEEGFLDAFYGKTQIHDPNVFSLDHHHGFESLGFYGHFELSKHFLGIAFEPFIMTKNNNRYVYKGEYSGQSGELNSYYVGLRIFKDDYKGFDWDFTFLQQKGEYANDDIDAHAYHLLLAYKFKQIALRPRISMEYSYSSGDSDPNDGKHETFDGAFGSRDRMYGRMNLFRWMNLKDAQINLEVKPKDWLYVKVEFHQFWLARSKDAWYLNPKEYRDTTGSSGRRVGKEFDLVGRLHLPKGNQIEFGFSHFWPDEFAKKQASDKQANWVFLQWVYKFSHQLF